MGLGKVGSQGWIFADLDIGMISENGCVVLVRQIKNTSSYQFVSNNRFTVVFNINVGAYFKHPVEDARSPFEFGDGDQEEDIVGTFQIDVAFWSVDYSRDGKFLDDGLLDDGLFDGRLFASRRQSLQQQVF